MSLGGTSLPLGYAGNGYGRNGAEKISDLEHIVEPYFLCVLSVSMRCNRGTVRLVNSIDAASKFDEYLRES